ncbi:MAG: ATP-binding protein [Thermodesulfobacteriota bacterium]
MGQPACRCGRSLLFLKAVKLFRELHAARADNSWEAELRKLLAPDLLTIDDFGLKPHDHDPGRGLLRDRRRAPSPWFDHRNLQPAAG